jgi:hypothetical protein
MTEAYQEVHMADKLVPSPAEKAVEATQVDKALMAQVLQFAPMINSMAAKMYSRWRWSALFEKCLMIAFQKAPPKSTVEAIVRDATMLADEAWKQENARPFGVL